MAADVYVWMRRITENAIKKGIHKLFLHSADEELERIPIDYKESAMNGNPLHVCRIAVSFVHKKDGKTAVQE
jgi:hypothetical protein